MKYNKLTVLILSTLIAIMVAGCGEDVPVGHVGVIMEPGGLQNHVYQPGRHFVGPRSRLILIEKKELLAKEPLSILCKDDLNFGFDLLVRTRLKAKDVKGVMSVLERQGSSVNASGVLPAQILYDIYVRPAARSISRAVASQYETTQIRENRDAIQKAITKKLVDALKGTPMVIMAVYTSNFDYPKVITDAMELTKKRQVEIKQMEAKKAVDLLAANSRREVAEQEKATRVAEAEKESAYNTIVARSVTPEYVRLREIELELKKVEAQKVLYQRVGKGDKVIITGGGSTVMPVVQTSASLK